MGTAQLLWKMGSRGTPDETVISRISAYLSLCGVLRADTSAMYLTTQFLETHFDRLCLFILSVSEHPGPVLNSASRSKREGKTLLLVKHRLTS